MSARTIDGDMLAALQSGKLRPALFFEGEYLLNVSPRDTGYLRLWSGLGTISWNGKDWTGAGNLVEIGQLRETRNLHAVGFNVTLSGVSASLLSIALASMEQGRAGTLWLAALDENGAIIGSPIILKKGRLDTNQLAADGASSTIRANYESRLIDLDKPRERYYTPEDQKIDYPTDKGFEYVAAIQAGINVNWIV